MHSPNVEELVVVVAVVATVELLKRLSRGTHWEAAMRRALPLVAPTLGAAIRAGWEVGTQGGDWWSAVVSGAIAGALAVWSHQVRRVTAEGQLRPRGDQAAE